MAAPSMVPDEATLLGIAQQTQAILDPGGVPITDLPRPLTEEEVRQVLARHIDEAESMASGTLASERKTGRDYYAGKPFGNEKGEGYSNFVSLDVLKVVEWIKPALMRIFTSSETMGRFMPEYEEGEPFEICEARAEQATDYIGRKFDAGGGFMFLLTMISDALLEKVGAGKVIADRKVSRAKKTFRDLSEAELVHVLSDPGTIAVSHSAREEDVGLRDPETGAPVPVPLHDLTVIRMTADPDLEWVAIPPEHFLHSPGHPAIDDRIPFIGDRCKRTRSELLAMGLPQERVFSVPAAQDPSRIAANAERYSDEGGLPRDLFRPDKASEEVWFIDGYLLIDEDGDGFSERRRILAGGDSGGLVILADEEVSDHPYFGFSPIPLSHKIDGFSMPDIMADLQKLRSTIIRQVNEFVFLNNYPLTEVDDAQVNIDDMLTRRPGGIVRVRQIGAIMPHPPQGLPGGVFELLAGLDGEIESRTGVSQATQMMDPAAGKNQTMGGIYELMNTASMRIDLIARIAAECAIKPMFAKALRLLHEHPPKREIMRLRGKYVEINPAEWNPSMKVEIDVVIGAGQTGQRLDALKSIVEWQIKLREMGLVHMAPDQKLYAGVTRLVREAGFKYPESFFADPALAPPPPPPPPDPDLIKAISQDQKRQSDVARDRAELMVEAHATEAQIHLDEAMAVAQLMQAQASLISAQAAVINAKKKPQGGGAKP
jgi:hypothetical protein